MNYPIRTLYALVLFLLCVPSFALEVGDKLIVKKSIPTDGQLGVADFFDGNKINTPDPKNNGKISCRISVLNGPRGDVIKPLILEVIAADNDLGGSTNNHFNLRGYNRPLSLFCWKLGNFEIVFPKDEYVKSTFGSYVEIKKTR